MGDSGGSVVERRIFVVEDDPATIRLYEEAFAETESDVELIIATDGQEGLDRLFGGADQPPIKPPDVILLDLDLPRVGGTEVLREIQRTGEFAEIPVIIISQNEDQATIDECYRLGASAVMRKPNDYERLLEVTRKICDFWATEYIQVPSVESQPT